MAFGPVPSDLFDGIFQATHIEISARHQLFIFGARREQQGGHTRQGKALGSRIGFNEGDQMLTQIHGKQNELKITHCQGQIYQGLKTHALRYIYRMENNELYLKIASRLAEIRLTERQASLQAVGNSQFIRNIRKGTSNSPRAENIIKLAQVLKVNPSWLMGSNDEKELTAPKTQIGLRFGGIVEAGTFRPHNNFDQDEAPLIEVPADPRYPQSSQFAFKVMGDSMTEAKIFEGMFVLAIDIHAYEKLHGEPQDGKLVIVARTRNGEPERELTVKRLRIFRDRLELRPESLNLNHLPLVFPNPPSHDEHQDAQIIAVVLSAIWNYG